jgi:hypothetical protein
MTTNITESDEGKTVVDETGEDVGIVTEVQHDTAYVEPDPGLTDELKAKLGWGDVGEETFPLQETRIESVTEDEIRLRSV